MQTLSVFLRNFPGVKPLKARQLILEGILISCEERADIYVRNASFMDTVLQVGPDAAAAILAAYKSGKLPMQKGQRPVAAPDAEAYLSRSAELRSEINERKRRELAIKDPSLIVECDLRDHQLLNSVFFANIGPGAGAMRLAGITVQKTLVGHDSNSGKSTGWRVRFDWTGSDGEPHYSESVPPEAHNRRNDPERNYGLGRE